VPVAGRLRRAADPAPPDEADDVAATVVARAAAAADATGDLAERALGRRPAVAHGPEAAAGWGPHAYGLALATDDPAWSGPLVVRAAGAAEAATEPSWLGVVAAAGVDVPPTVAYDAATGVAVFRRPAGTPLNERMVADLTSLPDHLAGLGRLHARIHAVPIDAAGGAVTPLADLDDLVALTDHRAVGDAVGAEAQRLATARPPASDPVVCHGQLNPVHVVSDGDAATAVTVPVNWTRAGLGDRELDVAETLTGFWSAVHYIDSALQRRLYAMARDSLASGYRGAYEAAAPRPLDDARLRYWQAVALCRLAAGIARHLADGPADAWDPAAAVVKPRAALDEIRGRVRELLAG
jgi:hypothetical protein